MKDENLRLAKEKHNLNVEHEKTLEKIMKIFEVLP